MLDREQSLCGKQFVVPGGSLISPWKEIEVGIYDSKEGFKRAIANNDRSFTGFANSLIDNAGFVIETTPRNIRLFIATVAQFGFLGLTGKIPEVYSKLHGLGFGDCPDETALHVYKGYKDLPADGWYRIVSEPKDFSHGYPRVLNVLSVGRFSDGPRIDTCYASADGEWNSQSRLVICL